MKHSRCSLNYLAGSRNLIVPFKMLLSNIENKNVSGQQIWPKFEIVTLLPASVWGDIWMVNRLICLRGQAFMAQETS